jgi:hypothetical protein
VLPEVERRGQHGPGRALGRVGHEHLQDATFPVAGTRGTVVDPGVDGPLAGEVNAADGVVPEVGGLYSGSVGGSGRGGLSSSLASATTPLAQRRAGGRSEQQRELCLASLMTSP